MEPHRGAARAYRRAPRIRHGDAATAPGYVGCARSVAPGAGNSGDGQAIPRRCRALAGLLAGDGPLSRCGTIRRVSEAGSAPVARVRQALAEAGITARVMELPE